MGNVPAPICNPHPTPAVAMQLGADQLPSGRRATTSPEPALPEKTKPALRMVKTARPGASALIHIHRGSPILPTLDGQPDL